MPLYLDIIIQFLNDFFFPDYGNDVRMNGDIPNVPVTTLSGLASLTQRKYKFSFLNVIFVQ